ncbi:hypothetical protein B296_00015634 [Ensete ventricosum]|uniref:Uncharacterized protein n=1 Tax=Ensete ventricosum TaxID=4639 RepID=A0A427A8H5_ENSVE|nr:hypothetical protein B296_00015634 [Ensete ventricosum]
MVSSKARSRKKSKMRRKLSFSTPMVRNVEQNPHANANAKRSIDARRDQKSNASRGGGRNQGFRRSWRVLRCGLHGSAIVGREPPGFESVLGTDLRET